jgi:hypothetical protein
MLKTAIAAAAFLLAAGPAGAHLMVPFEVRGPSGVHYLVSTPASNTELNNFTGGFLPPEGLVDSTVYGYQDHGAGETLSCVFEDGLGQVSCATQFVGIYEPQWHFKTNCRVTFTFDALARSCATTCEAWAAGDPGGPAVPSGKPLVFPNPLRLSDGGDAVFFRNLPSSTRFRIFTITGRPVFESVTGADGDLHWHLATSDGRAAGSGVYRAVADGRDGGRPVSLTFAIQR